MRGQSLCFNMCTVCGEGIQFLESNEHLPQVCPNCRKIHYYFPVPSVVVGLVVVYADRGRFEDKGLLCVQRKNNNTQDVPRYSLLSGHVNSGESLQTALSREGAEELGIQIPVDAWQYVGGDAQNESLAFFAARRPILSFTDVQKHFQPNEEVDALHVLWFDCEDTGSLCFPPHQEFANWFIREGFLTSDSVYERKK